MREKVKKTKGIERQMETQKRFTVMQVNGSPHRMPFKSRLEG